MAGALALALLTGCSGGSSPAAAPTTSTGTTPAGTTTSSAAPAAGPATPVDAPWPGYHADQARTGAVAQAVPDHLQRAWTADLGGAVRGQPVVAGGLVVAATETDRVVGLDPASGAVRWSASLGTPLRDVDSVAGCGNIDPLGITSTPVVDAATGTVFVVGEVTAGSGVQHVLEGLDVATGAVRVRAVVDPPLPSGESSVTLLQRASPALANGRVYVSYGGNAGDCGHYHGWVVGAQESDPTRQVSFEVAADGEGGAVWQSGGAPAVDDAGNLYVTTGNANPDPPEGGPDPKRYTESVVELSPDLRPLASFKDTVAGGDEDLSTGNPVLLPGGRVFATGKTDIGFVLTRDGLHQQAAVHGICGSDPDGGPAYDAASGRLFVPCRHGGIQVVDVARGTLGPLLPGADSAPVVAGGRVLALDTGSGSLVVLDAATGAHVQTVPVAASLPVFESPTVALGLVLVPTGSGVTALR